MPADWQIIPYISVAMPGSANLGSKTVRTRTQDNVDPLFAPKEIHSSRIVTWSLPYNLPFKVIDFLFVIPLNVKYYLVGNDAGFINEFLNSTEGIEREFLIGLQEIQPEENQQVRIIDTDGSSILGTGVPAHCNILMIKKSAR